MALQETPLLASSRISNFYYSFILLPKEKRDAIKTVYAFCRYTDDIVDEGETHCLKTEKLRHWFTELEKAFRGTSRYFLLNTLASVVQKFHIPTEYFYDLIRGIEMDMVKNRYETYEELYQYCYLVAATVGLISIEIFGYKSQQSKQYAVNLGVALQLTNILRDLKTDAKKGRIYLPQEDLKRFAYSPDDLFNNVYNPPFLALMKFECERAKSFFQKANESLVAEDKPMFYSARIMEQIYWELLQRIERVEYDVFHHRVRLSNFNKLMIATKIWSKYRLLHSYE